MEVVGPIPVKLNRTQIETALRMGLRSDREELDRLIRLAESLTAARAVYTLCYVDAKEGEGVTVDGVPFTSRVLRKQLDQAGRVFPYVVTIGPQLEERARAAEDLLEQYTLDIIANVALTTARASLSEQLQERYALGNLSYLNPGSLADWPLTAQQPLFGMLGDVKGAIGVELTDSLLMIPAKSVSGIFFPTEKSFQACQLCPREDCPGRRASYNEEMAREYGVL